MPYFLTQNILNINEESEILGKETRHIQQVRRIKVRDVIIIQDAAHYRYECQVVQAKNSYMKIIPQKEIIPPSEPHFKIHLYIPYLKEKPLAWLIAKTVELGAMSVTLFQSEYSKTLPKGATAESKLQRWEQIAWEACKQSNRWKPTAIKLGTQFRTLVKELQEKNNNIIIFHADDVRTLEKMSQFNVSQGIREISVFVGPEGGFSEVDLYDIQQPLCFLGQRLLKAETAAITAINILQYMCGDMNWRQL